MSSLPGVQLGIASIHRFVRAFVRLYVHLRRDLMRMRCSVRTDYTRYLGAARVRMEEIVLGRVRGGYDLREGNVGTVGESGLSST